MRSAGSASLRVTIPRDGRAFAPANRKFTCLRREESLDFRHLRRRGSQREETSDVYLFGEGYPFPTESHVARFRSPVSDVCRATNVMDSDAFHHRLSDVRELYIDMSPPPHPPRWTTHRVRESPPHLTGQCNGKG